MAGMRFPGEDVMVMNKVGDIAFSACERVPEYFESFRPDGSSCWSGKFGGGALLKKALFAIASLLLFSPYVYGHAILLHASPGPNQTVDGRAFTVRLQFNSRIDTKRSRLVLISTSGDGKDLPIDGGLRPDCVASQASGVKAGAYVLRWQVLAVDGHISRGEVPFHVR